MRTQVVHISLLSWYERNWSPGSWECGIRKQSTERGNSIEAQKLTWGSLESLGGCQPTSYVLGEMQCWPTAARWVFEPACSRTRDRAQTLGLQPAMVVRLRCRMPGQVSTDCGGMPPSSLSYRSSIVLLSSRW